MESPISNRTAEANAVHDPWPQLLERYRAEPLLPHLFSPAWMRFIGPEVVFDGCALLRCDENGDPRRQVLVSTGEAPALADLVATLAPGDQAEVAMLVGDDEGADAKLAGLGFKKNGDYLCMGADVPERRQLATSVVDMQNRPELIESLAETINRAFGEAKGWLAITPDRLEAELASNPLWDARNVFVVVDQGVVVATARVNVEERADGSRFGFIRGLAIPEARRHQSSLNDMMGLYCAMITRLQALSVPRWYLKVVPHAKALQFIYRKLGFEFEGRVARYSRPCGLVGSETPR